MSLSARIKQVLSRQPTLILSGFVAGLVALISLFASLTLSLSNREREQFRTTQMFESGKETELMLQSHLFDTMSLSNDVQNLKKSLATLSDGQKASVQLQDLAGQLELTNNRLKALETALIDSPEKALSLPLMRRDISALQQSLEVQRTSANAELERIYDFNKWFFGLFALLAFSIVGVAATSLFKGRKEKAE